MHKLFSRVLFKFLLIGGLLEGSYLAALDNKASGESSGGKVAAEVNGETISVDEVLQEMENFIKAKMQGKQLSVEERKELYKVFVSRKVAQNLIAQQAKSSGVEKNPDYAKELGTIEQEFRKAFYMKLKKKEIEEQVISDAELEKAVSAIKEYMIVLEQMVVGKNVAFRVVKAIRGANEPSKEFVKLAKTHAKGARKGDKIEVQALLSEIPDDTLRQVIEKMKAGEIVIYDPRANTLVSDEVAKAAKKTSEGKDSFFLVLRLKEKKLLADQKMKEAMAKQKIISKRMEDFLKNLSVNSKVKCFDMEGNVMQLPGIF